MAEKKFTIKEIGSFDDRSENFLADPNCLGLFEKYLKTEGTAMLRRTLELWKAADAAYGNKDLWKEEAMIELLHDIDGFNEHHLDITKWENKMDYIKQQCSKIFDEHVKDGFIIHLKKYHKAC